MAKDKITEYDATANNNTVCGDVNIAENSALPSDMNNFAREIMSHLKEGLGSGTPLYVDQTNNLVGIGTSSPSSFNGGANNLVVGTGSGSEGISIYAGNSSNSAIFFADTDSTTTGQINYKHASNSFSFHTNGGIQRLNISSGGDISFYEDTGTTPKLFWDASTERLGIGTSSPASFLSVYQNDTVVDGTGGVTIEQDGTGDARLRFLLTATQGYTLGIDNSDSDKFKIGTSDDLGTNNLLTLDTSGNLTLSGLLAKASMPVGSVLQVVKAETTTEVGTTGTSYIDTGLTASITPSSTSSKILVTYSVQQFFANATGFGVLKLVRDTTDIQEHAYQGYGGTSTLMSVSTYQQLDTPSTTSSTTYKVQFKGNGSNVICQYDDANGDSISTITLMEIAG